MKRRNFFKSIFVLFISSLIFKLGVNKAYAFFPFLLRFLISGALRSNTIRIIQRANTTLKAFSIINSLSDGLYIRKISAKSLTNHGISIGHIKEVSTDLHELCLNVKPTALWVNGSQNTFSLVCENLNNENINGTFLLKVRSTISDDYAIYSFEDIQIKANRKKTLLLEAPLTLEGRVIVLDGKFEDIPNIQVSTSAKIVLANDFEVTI